MDLTLKFVFYTFPLHLDMNLKLRTTQEKNTKEKKEKKKKKFPIVHFTIRKNQRRRTNIFEKKKVDPKEKMRETHWVSALVPQPTWRRRSEPSRG